MDVTRSKKSAEGPPLASTRLNQRKTPANAAWDHALNRATAKPKHDLAHELAHGVTKARTLETAHLNDDTDRKGQRAFGTALNTAQATRTPEKTEATADTSKLQKTSQTLVNQFFVGSMLKQMRDDPFKDSMFSGGKGGDAYAGLFDQHIAEHAGNRIAKGLVKSMVKQYQRAANSAQSKGVAA